jgi:lambda family phage tail tape measure protein
VSNLIGQLLVELGINTAAFKGGLDKATYQAKQFGNEVKRSFSELGSSVSGLAREMGASFGPVSGAIDVVSASFKSLSTVASGIGEGVAAPLVAVVGVSAGVMAALAAIGVGYGIMAQEGHEAVEQLVLMSEKMGVSIDHLQNLKAAGESVNIPIERMQMGFRKLAAELADMGLKSTKATDLLAKLGVTSKDPYEAMLQIADGISKVSDKTVQLNDANTLFGARFGAQLLPLLKKGREGFEEYGQVVDDFGQRVSGNAVDATEKWKKSTIELHTAWDGFKIEFADSTWVNGLTTALAKTIKVAGEIASLDKKNNPLLFPVFNDKSGFGAAQGDAGKNAASAKDSDEEKAREAVTKAAAAARELYMHVKEGGPAGVALADAMQRIKEDTEDSANADYKDAAIWQAKLPALQEAARLEKQRTEMLLTAGKKTDSAINEQSVSVTKAYAAAIKAQGEASAEASTQENIRMAIAKFSQPYIEAGAENTVRFREELVRFTKAAGEAAYAEAAFAKAAESNKLLDEYAKKTAAATKATEAAAEQTSKIGKAWASMDEQLDAAKRAVTEQGERLTALKNAYGALNPDVEKAQQLFGASLRALEADTEALEKNKQAVAARITAETLQAEQKELDKTSEYLELLKTLPESYAKATSGAMAKAAAAGLDADATKKEVDMAKQQVALQQQLSAAQTAHNVLFGAKEEAQQIELNIAAIKAQSAAFIAQGGDVQVVNRALDQEYAKLLQVRAAQGGVLDGAKAGVATFMASTESMGTMISNEVNKGLEGVSEGFAQMVTTGKADWKSLEESMEAEMVKFAMSSVLKSVLSSLGGLLGGSGNGFLSSLGDIFGGGKAGGGDLTPGKTYLVGENGPELFSTGLSGGSITPNGSGGSGGGGNVTVIQNIQAPDVDSFKSSQAQIHAAAFGIASRNAARVGR